MIGREWERRKAWSGPALIRRGPGFLIECPKFLLLYSFEECKLSSHIRRRWLGGPPVPIPNTEVKHPYAESTWLETAREVRELPVYSVRIFADVTFMAGVVKWLTHWIVAPARMGSIPIARPILQGYSSIGRVVVSKTIGCGFKSYCPCHEIHNPLRSSNGAGFFCFCGTVDFTGFLD